jgi:hypothetical protein
MTYFNEEVSCTEPSPSVSIHWHDDLVLIYIRLERLAMDKQSNLLGNVYIEIGG